MQSFGSSQEAKEYLIARIVLAAERAGVALSDTERKMMYFTETGWTLPDISAVNEAFEREYDAETYENKIRTLAQVARAYAKLANELQTWSEAVRVLQAEDHYLLVLLTMPTVPPKSAVVDRLKLLGTALLICLLLIVGMFILSSTK